MVLPAGRFRTGVLDVSSGSASSTSASRTTEYLHRSLLIGGAKEVRGVHVLEGKADSYGDLVIQQIKVSTHYAINGAGSVRGNVTVGGYDNDWSGAARNIGWPREVMHPSLRVRRRYLENIRWQWEVTGAFHSLNAI